jgi:hypothetical protein
MKNYLFYLSILLLSFSACKQGDNVTPENPQLDALAKQFQLKKESNISTNLKPLNFQTVNELNEYLTKKKLSQKRKVSTLMSTSPKKTMDIPPSNAATGDGFGPAPHYNIISSPGPWFDPNGSWYLCDGGVVSMYFSTTTWPAVYGIKWLQQKDENVIRDVEQKILLSGNSGNYWAYVQESGSGVIITQYVDIYLETTGTYTEYFNIDGLSFSKSWRLHINYILAAGIGDMTADIGYQEIL